MLCFVYEAANYDTETIGQHILEMLSQIRTDLHLLHIYAA